MIINHQFKVIVDKCLTRKIEKKRVKKVGLHYHVPVILDPQSFIDTRNSILHLNKSNVENIP